MEAATGLKQSLGRLDVQRKSLEMEGEAIISELTAEPEGGGEPMGVDTPLVDQDGYPRGDVDVYRARDLRGRLAVIRTDHKALMKQIDSLLKQLASVQNPSKSEEETKEQAARAAPKPKPKYDAKTGKWVVKNFDGTVFGIENGEKKSFETLKDDSASITTPANMTTTLSASAVPTTTDNVTATPTPSTPPFAKIDSVALLSPASEAGMKEGDLIIEFGSVNHNNHQNLTALMPVVTGAADAQKAISIFLQRQSTAGEKTIMKVELVPKPWPGRGLIGCHIVPYSESS